MSFKKSMSTSSNTALFESNNTSQKPPKLSIPSKPIDVVPRNRITLCLPTSVRTRAVPKEMQSLSTWVCRRADKKPVNPQTGQLGSSTNPSTWNTYEKACDYADKHPAKVSGIGFAFTKESGIVGVDFDHCLDTDHKFLDPMLKQIYEMANSYAEISPSGSGLHFYVKGEWPKGIGNRHKFDNGMIIEVYCEERFFSVTGNRFGKATDIIENQTVLDFIRDMYFPKAIKQNCQTPVADGLDDLDVDESIKHNLLKQLQDNAYLAKLWAGERPKNDESADDMALLCRLAILADGDTDLISKLFLASPHAKSKDKKHLDKLDRKDYLPNSIMNALSWVSENPDFSKDDNDMKLFAFTDNDSGNADKFLYAFGDIAKYCSDYDSWFVYDGMRWREDCKRYEIGKCCVELYQRAMKLINLFNPASEQIAIRKKRFIQLGNCATRANLIKTAELKSSVPSSTFNQHNNLLVSGNGIVDLKTGVLLPHDSSNYITLMTTLTYNPESQSPTRFLQFLNEIFDGDAGLISYVHRLLGYCLTGETNVQSYFILYGAGSNGKSVLLNLIQRMFPEYVKTVAPGAFLKKRDVNCPNSTLVNAKDARMVLVSETAKGSELDEILIKRSSGQDTIMVREMYKAEIEITPHFKTVFSTNHIPNIDWSDRAMVRRSKIIPFTHIFSGAQIDYELADKLWAEREGIFAWLVQGAVEYYKNGLGELPDSVNSVIEQQRMICDSFYGFFRDSVEVTASQTDPIQAASIYNQYKAWCINNDMDYEQILTSTAFGRRMSEMNIAKKTLGQQRCRYYIGVRLKSTGSVPVDSNLS